MKTNFKNHDQYIKAQRPEARLALRALRQLIRKSAPMAEETISWGMPTFKYNGILVCYAAFKNHYSLFPTSNVIKDFKYELRNHITSKGTIQFQYGQKLPVALLKRIIKFRIQENIQKEAIRKLKKVKR